MHDSPVIYGYDITVGPLETYFDLVLVLDTPFIHKSFYKSIASSSRRVPSAKVTAFLGSFLLSFHPV
jgi:hypothetical protein